MSIVDVPDDDVEADKKRIRERCLPVDSPLLFISDENSPGGLLGPIFAGYVPLASQNPYPIIVIFYGQL